MQVVSRTKYLSLFDTDVGSFIDDSFAIVFAALNEYLDIKLIVTCYNDVTARAKVAAKLLHLIGHDDIPIGIGIKNDNSTAQTLYSWAEHIILTKYGGKVYNDGVGKMAEIIASSPTPVRIIAIGPTIHFPTLIQRYPNSILNSRVVAMADSILNSTKYDYNVHMCPYCFEAMLRTGWDTNITPTDTCRTARLDVPELKQVLQVDQVQSLGLASSLAYFCLLDRTVPIPCDMSNLGTPILYDTVAVLLALPVAGKYLEFKKMMLTVDCAGRTLQNQTCGALVNVALSWKDEGTLYGRSVVWTDTEEVARLILEYGGHFEVKQV